jgi:SOS response regulatory protein OraA/RecX
MSISGIGGASGLFGISSAPKLGGTGAATEFKNYMEMTPEERMIQSILTEMGISKEAFEAMSPQEQTELLAKVKEKIEDRVKEQTRQADKGERVDIYV